MLRDGPTKIGKGKFKALYEQKTEIIKLIFTYKAFMVAVLLH